MDYEKKYTISITMRECKNIDEAQYKGNKLIDEIFGILSKKFPSIKNSKAPGGQFAIQFDGRNEEFLIESSKTDGWIHIKNNTNIITVSN